MYVTRSLKLNANNLSVNEQVTNDDETEMSDDSNDIELESESDGD